MTLSPANAQDIGAREQQQDSFGFSNFNDSAFVLHGGVVAVVADGMGGMAHGNAASQTAVRSFLSGYAAKSPQESIPQALDRALKNANKAVVNLARSAGLEDGMGTTLVAAAVHHGSLYWISAGDSRVYLLRNGQVSKLNADHIYANELRQDMVEGKLSRAEAMGNAQRGDLTSYLGLDEVPEIDRNLRPFPIHTGESVILCTDGLYRGLREDEIAASFQGDPQTACERLVQRVLAKHLPHQDNITVIALKCGPKGARTRGAHTKIAVAVSSVFFLAALGLGGYWWWRTEHPASEPVAANQEAPPVATAAPPAAAIPTPPSNPVQSQGSQAPQPKNVAPSAVPNLSSKVTLSPLSLDFGEQSVNGRSAPKQVTLTNREKKPLALRVELTGDYSLQGGYSPLEPGKSWQVSVSFGPQGPGKRDGTLTIRDNLERKYEVKLTGIGIARSTPPQPEKPGGSVSSSATGQAAAPGEQTKVVKPAAQTGQQPQNPGQTRIQELPLGTKTGGSAPQGTTAQSGQQNAVTSSAGSQAAPSGAGPVNLSAKSLTFSKLPINQISEPQIVELTNTGDTAVTLAVQIEGDDAENFREETNACVLSPLEKNHSCNIKVSFVPQGSGKKKAFLRITDSTHHNYSVELSGGSQSIWKRFAGSE